MRFCGQCTADGNCRQCRRKKKSRIHAKVFTSLLFPNAGKYTKIIFFFQGKQCILRMNNPSILASLPRKIKLSPKIAQGGSAIKFAHNQQCNASSDINSLSDVDKQPELWWARGDLNPHSFRNWNLNPACLPFHHAPRNMQADESNEGNAGQQYRELVPYLASAAFSSAAGASSSLISSTQTHCRSTILAASPLRVKSLRMRV